MWCSFRSIARRIYIWMGSHGVGTDHPGISAAEGGRGGGGALDGGSRAHVVVDTAEVFSVRGGGVYQGKECDRHSPEVYGPGEEFHWAKLLGEGVLRIDGGAGRGRDTALHPRTGERGQTARSTKDVRVASMPA